MGRKEERTAKPADGTESCQISLKTDLVVRVLRMRGAIVLTPVWPTPDACFIQMFPPPYQRDQVKPPQEATSPPQRGATAFPHPCDLFYLSVCAPRPLPLPLAPTAPR